MSAANNLRAKAVRHRRVAPEPSEPEGPFERLVRLLARWLGALRLGVAGTGVRLARFAAARRLWLRNAQRRIGPSVARWRGEVARTAAVASRGLGAWAAEQGARSRRLRRAAGVRLNARSIPDRLRFPWLRRQIPRMVQAVRQTLDARVIEVARQTRVKRAATARSPGTAAAAVRRGRSRLFRHAVPLEDERPDLDAARVLKLGAAGVAGTLAVLLIAAALLPAVTRSSARAVSLGIAPAKQAALSNLSQRSIVLASDGQVLAVLHDEIDRKVVGLEAIPKHVQDAVITAEDRKFREHDGYDFEGIGRALVANYRAGQIAQGGSTITQQIAKSVVGNERSLERKLNELAYALALEREYSKNELLERYLNQVYFGSGAYGIAAAAENYFGLTDLSQLRVEQSALLAAVIRSPGRLDPRRHPEEALGRRNQVLRDMAELGYLAPESAERFAATPLVVNPPPADAPLDPYLTAAVQREFMNNPAFGADRAARADLLLGGGLRIQTSLDPRLQTLARSVVNRALPSSRGPTAAVAAVDPRDGRILAIYGGTDFEQEQFDLATQGRRQPGSSFKPFVLATALAQGFPLQLKLKGDGPLIIKGSGSPEWERKGVTNFGGADYGRVDLRTALVKSVNTAFAQLMTIVGVRPVLDIAGGMGIDVPAATGNIENPSIALGGLEHGVTPLEMASAYGTFANGGRHATASLIDRVTTPDGRVLYERGRAVRKVIEPSVNAAMVDIMRNVVTEGTGARARLDDWTAAGKTGTTQRNADAWFVGYVPVMSTAVWMGYPEGQIAMPGRTGGSIPAGIWRAFMTQALAGQTPVPFPEVAFGKDALTGGPVVVPNVVGMNEFDAMRALGRAKLIGEIDHVRSRAKDGTVVHQHPRPGSTPRAGSTVTIDVSGARGDDDDDEDDDDDDDDDDKKDKDRRKKKKRDRDD